MTKWHRTRRGDFGIRALGLGACALSYASISHLMHLHDGNPARWTPNAFAYVLTAVGFLSASAGSAMMMLGAHLFDEVEISERWRVKSPSDSGAGIVGPEHVRSVLETGRRTEAEPSTPFRIDGISPARDDAELLLQCSIASVATSQRLQDRRGLTLATMAPMPGRSGR